MGTVGWYLRYITYGRTVTGVRTFTKWERLKAHRSKRGTEERDTLLVKPASSFHPKILQVLLQCNLPVLVHEHLPCC